MSASHEIVEAELTSHVYGTNSFKKVTPATEDCVGIQSQPSACNIVKYAKCAHQRFTVIDYSVGYIVNKHI